MASLSVIQATITIIIVHGSTLQRLTAIILKVEITRILRTALNRKRVQQVEQSAAGNVQGEENRLVMMKIL